MFVLLWFVITNTLGAMVTPCSTVLTRAGVRMACVVSYTERYNELCMTRTWCETTLPNTPCCWLNRQYLPHTSISMPTVNIAGNTDYCLLFLTGLDVEGLYRVSGKSNDILRIKKQFDNGKIINTLFCHGLIVSVCTMEQFGYPKDWRKACDKARSPFRLGMWQKLVTSKPVLHVHK